MNKHIRLLIEGLFDDDIFTQDEYDNSVEVAQSQISKLSYSTKLKPVVSKILNIEKPRGFKFKKSTNNEYEQFYFKTSAYGYYSVYIRELENLLKANNWIEFDFSTEEKKKNNNYTKYEVVIDFLNKYNNKNDQVHKIILSPDETLIYAHIFLNINGTYYTRFSYHMLTFTGKMTDNTLLSKKENRDNIKNAKLNQKLMKNFKKFLKKYNGLDRFNQYATKLEDDGYPYMFFTEKLKQYLIGDFNNFRKVRTMYKEVTPTVLNAVGEVISVNNPYVRVQFIYDKDHEYTNDDGIIFIKLTDKGKEAFDKFNNEN